MQMHVHKALWKFLVQISRGNARFAPLRTPVPDVNEMYLINFSYFYVLKLSLNLFFLQLNFCYLFNNWLIVIITGFANGDGTRTHEHFSYIIFALYSRWSATSNLRSHLRLLAPWAARLLSQWMLHWWRDNNSTAREALPNIHLQCSVSSCLTAATAFRWLRNV